MQDGIIAGNGNSRYLKTVAAALSLYPTYQDFMTALIAGTFPIDLNGINEAGWSQLGTALNKANLLTDATAQAIGLTSTATPDEALEQIAKLLLNGVSIIKITTKFSDGRIAPGVPLSGDLSGATIITDDNGQAYITVKSGVATTILVSGVIDLNGSVSSGTNDAGAIVEKTLTVTAVNFKSFTSSQTIKISGACTRVDVSVGGGGGGGGASRSDSGSGGGGGYAVTQENVDFEPNTSIQVVIGSGGVGAQGGRESPGGDGGATSVLGVSAAGGKGGSDDNGGTGNGNGGSAVFASGVGNSGENGTQYVYDSFNNQKLFGGGGGSGGATSSGGPQNNAGGLGGYPGGGDGATASSSDTPSGEDGETGLGGGGGGGALRSGYSYPSSCGSGGSGYAALRMWHGEENQ